MDETPRGRFQRWIDVGWRAAVVSVALLVLVGVSCRWRHWDGAPGWKGSDDAYLQGDLTPIAAKVAGYVRRAPLQDYQRVAAGQLLVELVDDDYRTALAQAEAGLESARAQVETLKAQRVLQQANVKAAGAATRAIGANLAQTVRDQARQAKLQSDGSSSVEGGEKIAALRQQQEAQVTQLEAQAEAAARQLAVLTAQQGQAEASVHGQAASLQQARLNLGYTHIVAPQAGVLGPRQVRVGQYVGVGGQIAALIPLPTLWVTANFKETQLTHMAVGQRAEITIDAFPGRTLKGHVTGFAPGAGSQFTLLPPDNASGNFTKVVQRVAVKIALDDTVGLADRLRAGMSVVARVDARDGRP
jgi:membrane fusion protein (multidrug efflux system)